MFSSLEEIVEKIRHHPRLIIAEDFEICSQLVCSDSRKFRNGESIQNALDHSTWVSLRILHRKRPGKSVAWDVENGGLARLVDTAFESAESSTPDLWFRFPLWKQNRKTEVMASARPVDGEFPDSLYPRLRIHPDILEESYEYLDVATLIARKTEKAQLRHQKRLQILRYSILNHQGDHFYRIRDEKVQSQPITDREFRLEELLRRSFGVQKSRPFGGLEQGDLILGPAAGAAVIKKMAGWFCADAAHTGRSPLRESIGTALLAPCLSLVDDATLPGGAETVPFDLEGVPTQKTLLVDKGVAKSLLYDTYWATRENRLSTGNFSRHTHAPWPGIVPSNFYVPPGRVSPDSLISSVGRGVILEDVESLELASATEEISLRGFGWKIERGRRLEPVHNLSLRCNLLTLLRRAVGVANDLTFWGRFGAPSIFFENIPLGVLR